MSMAGGRTRSAWQKFVFQEVTEHWHFLAAHRNDLLQLLTTFSNSTLACRSERCGVIWVVVTL